MIGINTSFQYVSVRRRIIITFCISSILTVAVGLYALMAIIESNNRLHDSIRTGEIMTQMTDTALMAQVHLKKQVQEWKNILLRGNDPILFQRHLNAFEKEERLVSDNLHKLKKMTEAMHFSVPRIDELIEIHQQLGQKYRDALESYKQPDLRSAVIVDKMVRGIDREPTNKMDNLLYAVTDQAEKRLRETEILATTTLNAHQSFSIFLILLVLMGVAFGIFMTLSILRDLDKEKNIDEIEGTD